MRTQIGTAALTKPRATAPKGAAFGTLLQHAQTCELHRTACRSSPWIVVTLN